ncbi:33792_t:CDS:2 [Racocetra persica]|uniref:33792_t:CDS:1 n=1 Tax=Racocetra persica TaxID=160502 RepID=A0ACA9S0E4_9GLOM|nr:33792_t:CDS:2 [Racocetra persica]
MTPQEKSLKATRQKLKSLLAGLKIDGQDAYQQIKTDIKNSETALNKAIEIWQKCQEIDTATNDDKGELLDALNNLKNDTHNSTVWTAINKYRKDGQDQAQQRQKDYSQVKNAQNPTEFAAAKNEFMNKHEYKNNKQDYDEIYFPLAEKAAEIRAQGDQANSDEKELTKLITIVVSDYTDWKTQLTDLEDKLNKLKSYTQGNKHHNIIANYSSIQQEALKKMINKMETKLQE